MTVLDSVLKPVILCQELVRFLFKEFAGSVCSGYRNIPKIIYMQYSQ